MKNFENYDEFTFVRELSEKIEQKFPNYILHTEYKIGKLRPDIYIQNNTEDIIIEVKMLRNYSSLPFSTLNQLEDYKHSFNRAKIVLITFTFINNIVLDKLKLMDILLINNPNSFDEIVNKIFKKNFT